jgi:hypothetical protein
MSTEVRKDLGDSYEKAFQSVPEILEDYGLEKTVQIPSSKNSCYSGMEISEENIFRVKGAYEEFSRLMDNLKPKVVADMISEKINPLGDRNQRS